MKKNTDRTGLLFCGYRCVGKRSGSQGIPRATCGEEARGIIHKSRQAKIAAAPVVVLLLIWIIIFTGCGPHPLVYATLTEAVEHGDVADARRHLQRGADVDEAGEEGWSALMVAAYTGDMKLIRLLMRYGADINARNEAGATPLMVAVYSGHSRAVCCLLNKGADVNARTLSGQTSLMLAVRKGDPRVVQYLLEKGADANAEDRNGITVLMEVTRLEKRTGFRRSDITACLEQHGAME